MKYKSRKNLTVAGSVTLVLVIIDQFTKYLASAYLKGQPPVALIEDVFELHYLENQSAAFSMDPVSLFQKIFQIRYFIENPSAYVRFKMIFFVVLTVIVVYFLIRLYIRIPDARRFRYLNWILVAFTAGAIGNCIDRLIHNYVIDFFYFKLIDFPVFNVADIYVTVSAIFLIVLGIFYYKETDYEQIFPAKHKKEHS